MIRQKVRLYGVVSPTGQPGGFCVPVFVDDKLSNSPLVQIVDNDNLIVAFEPFDPSIRVTLLDIEISRKIYDPAFWYFDLRQPLFGTISEIRNRFSSIEHELNENPYTRLQIVTACGLETKESDAIRAVHQALLVSSGKASADAWLDTSIISPRIRSIFFNLFPKLLKSINIESLALVLAITNDKSTTILIPEKLQTGLKGANWKTASEQLIKLLKDFDLKFSNFFILPEGPRGASTKTNVSALKRAAVSAFGLTKETFLHQLTKSYFEDSSGALRVVCTFSSRYNDKGKRKYWFGFHEIWNQWLEGSKDGFLILGCMDTRICYALPLSLVRSLLPRLRSTGNGKDKYWHLDIVDLKDRKNLLDVPRLKEELPLSKFSIEF